MEARFEVVEVRADARAAAFQATVDAFIAVMNERTIRDNERFERLEAAIAEMREQIRSLRVTIIVTALSSTIAIVLGVGTLNAAMLSHMIAAFESGKEIAATQAGLQRQSENTAAAQAELRRQSKETAATLAEIRRQSNETTVTLAENQRQSKETAMAQAELRRQSKETAVAQAELRRQSAETARLIRELTRKLDRQTPASK